MFTARFGDDILVGNQLIATITIATITIATNFTNKRYVGVMRASRG